MTFNPGYAAYTQGFGTAPSALAFPVYLAAAPTSASIVGPFGIYEVGQVAIVPNNSIWQLIGFSSTGGSLSANWVEIASSSGDVLAVNGTANQITASTTAGVVTLSIPSTFIAPGSIASTTTLTGGTGITATTGNITATTGNLVLSAAGSKLSIHATTAASDSVGTSGNMSGTPGAVTVSSTAITTSSIILFSRATTGGTPGQVSITAQTTGSFTLTSTGNETSTFNYLIIN